MKQKNQPIDYAIMSCNTMMRKFKAEDLPPKGHFHYHQGVFLSGVYETYCICKDEKYFQYIKDWVDSIIDEHGEIRIFAPTQLDDIQPGILLYPLLERTGDIRYKKALDRLMDCMDQMQKNKVGGFWHNVIFPNQMWLDGLYMGGPVCAEYGKRFDRPEYIDLCAQQAFLMQKYTLDEGSGLWYHAWDCSKKEAWADKATGLSPEFWGRSMGWVPVAVLDDLDFMNQNHPSYEKLCGLVKNLLTAVCRYQAEDGRWYQVIDKGGKDGNWLENSCSCLFAKALSKAVRKGIMDKSYLDYARRAYEGVVGSLEFEDENLLLGHVCIGTGVGNYKHYCDRPVSVNDLHGVGAFLLMCAELQKSIV